MSKAPRQQAKAPVAPRPAPATFSSKAPERAPAWQQSWPTAADTSHAIEPWVGYSLADMGVQRTALRQPGQQRPAVLARSADGTALVQRKVKPPGKTGDENENKTRAGRSATGFDGLVAQVEEIMAGVKVGQFVDASFKVAIPVPQVPGLSITVDASGSFLVDSKQQKELELKLGVGVQYSLADIFNVNVNINESLTLRGEKLGAALVDAVKQTAYWALEKAGVHEEFAELVALAKEGPGFWDYAKMLIPVYGNYHAAKVAVSAFGAENLIAAHEAFVAFFQNDASVGFEASIGVSAGMGIEVADTGASGTVEARAGLEDVGDRKTRGFTELAGELAGNKGNSSVRLRYSRRFREGGKRLKTIDVQSRLSMPKKAYNFAEGEKLVRNASMLLSIVSVFRALDKVKSGDKIGDSLSLVNALLGLGSQIFGNNEKFDSLWGLDIKLTETDGKCTVDHARIKLMTQVGTGTGVALDDKVEANAQVGTFFDVGGVLNMALAKYAGR